MKTVREIRIIRENPLPDSPGPRMANFADFADFADWFLLSGIPSGRLLCDDEGADQCGPVPSRRGSRAVEPAYRLEPLADHRTRTNRHDGAYATEAIPEVEDRVSATGSFDWSIVSSS